MVFGSFGRIITRPIFGNKDKNEEYNDEPINIEDNDGNITFEEQEELDNARNVGGGHAKQTSTGSSQTEENDYYFQDSEESILNEDPIAAAYQLNAEQENDSLELGNAQKQFAEDNEERPTRRTNNRGRLESAKEFFTSEVLYRFDLLKDEERKQLEGTYRIEIKGYKGGVWSCKVEDGELYTINRREEAQVVISIVSKDFVRMVNGFINPQIALLAQRIKFSGDIEKLMRFQILFLPIN